MNEELWCKENDMLLNELYSMYRGDFNQISSHIKLKINESTDEAIKQSYNKYTPEVCKNRHNAIQTLNRDTEITLDDFKSQSNILTDELDFSKNPTFSALYDQSNIQTTELQLDPSKVDFSKNVTKSIFGYDITPSNFNILYDDIREGYEHIFDPTQLNQIKFPEIDNNSKKDDQTDANI